MAWRRMHHHARGLMHHGKGVIFVEQFDRDGLGCEREARLRGEIPANHIIFAQRVTGLDRLRVHGDFAEIQPPLHLRARQRRVVLLGQIDIKAHALIVGFDQKSKGGGLVYQISLSICAVPAKTVSINAFSKILVLLQRSALTYPSKCWRASRNTSSSSSKRLSFSIPRAIFFWISG